MNTFKVLSLLAVIALCQASSIPDYVKHLDFVETPASVGKAPTPPVFPNQMSSAFSITYILPDGNEGLYGYSTTDLTVGKQRFDAGGSGGVLSSITVYSGLPVGATLYTTIGTGGKLSCSSAKFPLPLPDPFMLQNATYIGTIRLPTHGLCYGWRLLYKGVLDMTIFTRAAGTQPWAPTLIFTNLYYVEYKATKSVAIPSSNFDLYSICPASPSLFHPRSAEADSHIQKLLSNTFFL